MDGCWILLDYWSSLRVGHVCNRAEHVHGGSHPRGKKERSDRVPHEFFSVNIRNKVLKNLSRRDAGNQTRKTGPNGHRRVATRLYKAIHAARYDLTISTIQMKKTDGKIQKNAEISQFWRRPNTPSTPFHFLFNAWMLKKSDTIESSRWERSRTREVDSRASRSSERARRCKTLLSSTRLLSEL